MTAQIKVSDDRFPAPVAVFVQHIASIAVAQQFWVVLIPFGPWFPVWTDPNFFAEMISHLARTRKQFYSWTSSINVPKLPLGCINATVVPRDPGRGA